MVDYSILTYAFPALEAAISAMEDGALKRDALTSKALLEEWLPCKDDLGWKRQGDSQGVTAFYKTLDVGIVGKGESRL